MLNVLSDMAGVALYVFEGCCIRYLFSAFVAPRGSAGTWRGFAVVPFWTAVRIGTGVIFGGVAGADMVLKLLSGALSLFLFTVCWYRGALLLKVFVVAQFTAMRELALFAAYSLLHIADILIALAGTGFDEGRITAAAFEAAVEAIAFGAFLLVEAAQGALLVLAVRRIVTSCRYREGMDRALLYYLLPAAAGILVAVLLRLLMVAVEDASPTLLYSRHRSLYFIVPLIAFVLLEAIVSGFRLCQDMVGMQRERAERIVMENQISQMRASMEEMERFHAQVRAVRHDMHNHLTVLWTLLEREGVRDGELRRYFADVEASVGRLADGVHTGNAVSDAVVNGKFRYAAEEVAGIRLDADDFLAPREGAMRAYDIGVILNNGLDNAIEACRRLKEKRPDAAPYILLRSFRSGKMYFMEIENNFDGIVRMDEESGRPISVKTDGAEHGIGLRNIENCARKYAGDIDCVITDDTFVLSVMIKI